MQYTGPLSALLALSSALVIRQATNTGVEGVNIDLLPSYGCPGSDPIATVPASYLDGSCHSIGGFNGTQSVLSRTDVTQTLTFFEDDTCTTVANVLSNKANAGSTIADGTCVSAPAEKSFKAIIYTTSSY